MAALGLNWREVAAALNMTERRLRQIRNEASSSGGLVTEVPESRSYSSLDPEVQKMLEFSAVGFKLFYERFSGYTLPEHCFQWVQEFCTQRNLMLNVPPRHMKSSIFSLWVPVWLLCRDRNERILLVSLAKDSAKKWVAGIAEQLTVNQDIVRTFGRFKPVRAGEAAWRPMTGTLMVSGRKPTAGVQYSVESRGSRQQILGMEATVVIVDDVTDAKIAENPLEREKQIKWLRSDVFSRVETQTSDSSGRACVIGQRVHADDMYGQLEQQVYERGPREGEALWHTIKTPAILRWPDEDPENPEPLVLWPEKWNFDELMVTYERVGGHNVFSAMYQQNPLRDGSDIFKEEWFPRCRDFDRKGGDGVKGPYGQNFLPMVRVLSIDPSVKQYHGLVVADVMWDRARFLPVIIEAKRWRGSQRSIISEILRVLQTYRPDYFVFEDVSFIQWLKEDPFFEEIKKRTKVMPHQTGRNKGDQEMGVESLAREVEFGYIRLPYADDWGKAMSTDLEEEAMAWPHGKTSDILMALWFIKWNYKRFMPRDVLAGRMHWMPEEAGQAAWAGFERRLA